MQARIRSQSTVPSCSSRNHAYETSYQREFVLKRASPIVESVPFDKRSFIGSPFQLRDPIGDSLYTMDFANRKNTLTESFVRPNTDRANRPHPHKQFPYWPRRSESLCDPSLEEAKQALRNQLDSTYHVDYIGAAQGIELRSAYERSRPFWRDRAQYTLDSEYRNAYQNHPKYALFMGGHHSRNCRMPANVVVPETLSVRKKKSLQSTYAYEISQRAPTELFMKEFVDSLNGPMDL